MLELSPGVAQSCFDLLGLIRRKSLLISEIRGAFREFGSTSIGELLDCVQELNWISSSPDGLAALTSSGEALIELDSYELKLRKAVLDFIDIKRPVWLQNCIHGRGRALAFVGVRIGQTFLEAGVVDGTSSDVVEFWDALAMRARGQRGKHLLEIGRKGERLTMAYETERTRAKPRWVAIENNGDGYDVRSIVDVLNHAPLLIEVKTSTQGSSGSFHVTRNEWARAQSARDHVFHLWDASVESPRLAVLPKETLAAHVPIDQGDGSWESVSIPFEAFESLFLCPLE